MAASVVASGARNKHRAMLWLCQASVKASVPRPEKCLGGHNTSNACEAASQNAKLRFYVKFRFM